MFHSPGKIKSYLQMKTLFSTHYNAFENCLRKEDHKNTRLFFFYDSELVRIVLYNRILDGLYWTTHITILYW